jgi:hypothetical protein
MVCRARPHLATFSATQSFAQLYTMSSQQNPFIQFVLDDLSPSHSRVLAVFDHIRLYPEQVCGLMNNDSVKDQFLGEFADRSNRIVQLFHRARILKPARLEGRLATAILVGLLIPVLQESDELDRDALVKFITSALCVIVGNPPVALGMLAKSLANTPHILEILASDESGGAVLKAWSPAFASTIQDSVTLGKWTSRIVRMCDSCRGNHEVEDEVQGWKTLVAVKKSLRELGMQFSQAREKESMYQCKDMPLHSNMRPLDSSDKKSGKKSTKAGFQSPCEIPRDVIEALHVFNLPVPTSERAVANTIAELETEQTLSILQSTIASFPCRLCNESARERPSTPVVLSEEQGLLLTQVPPLRLHGKRVGVWKVLLSSQALKDLQNLSYSGKIRITPTHSPSIPTPYFLYRTSL